MARTDFTTPRLCVDDPLAAGARLALGPEAGNYLVNVLRLGPGARVLGFNGRDGEWACRLDLQNRKRPMLVAEQRTRAQEFPPDVEYLFAPLKHARLDYMAQKAVEMGARRLAPVITRRTQASRVNGERLAANAREACEQCGVIWIPQVDEPKPLGAALAELGGERLLVFCDEEAPLADPLAALAAAPDAEGVSLLVGPEGGFDDAERALVLEAPRVLRLSLGPRILRADTAAVAALALLQARFGDWRR
jgi:16S rRNA (uracil1498-N3)-methyltransferase